MSGKPQQEKKLKKISYSEFKIWKECPYRHKLIYIDELEPFLGNEFTAFGTAVHKTCESLIVDNQLCSKTVFDQAFNQELDILSNLNIDVNQDLVKQMFDSSENIFKELIQKVFEYFGEYEVYSIEEEIYETITEFESYGKSFKGFIDLVLRTKDGKYHIIDWKTCSWGWPSRKKTDTLVTYQLTYYKNFFAKKHDIDPKNIKTHFALLKRTAKSNNVEIFEVTSGKRKIENSLKTLQNALININNKNYIKNRLNCKYCKFYKTENCK